MKISELPQEVKEKALEYQKKSKYFDKITDELDLAFNWNKTIEGFKYWNHFYDLKLIENKLKTEIKEPKHYDNTNGSLYYFCSDKDLNTYEFDIIKRVMRCRKKGNFIEDLEKTKFLIDLYIEEQTEKIK